MDPCAGEGEAILALMKLLVKNTHPVLYASEMEGGRFEALKKTCEDQVPSLGRNLLHGDAFKVTFERGEKEGVSVLFLNPPYDIDRQHGRLEQKFLNRFTPALMQGGALLFVVPFYALKASASFLATEYENIHCFKFPDGDFEVFKQVVLFAQKADSRSTPDEKLLAKVERYAEGKGFKELPNITSKPLAQIVASKHYHEGLSEWMLRPTDVSALLRKVQPWVQTTRGGSYQAVRGVMPEIPLHDLLLRKYPVATPPRPAHIASGIASGIFNGSRVQPTNPKSKLPPLLVKGVFNQEYRTVEEKHDKDGNLKSTVQIQQPKLVVTVLDLATHKYHTLATEGGKDTKIENLTVSGLLHHYGESLMDVMRQQCPILYDPRRDADSISLAETSRKPFTAQQHAARALVSLLGGPGIPLAKREGKAAILLGEIGSGKSTVSLVVGKTIGARRPLVVCPPHLLTSWGNEVRAVLPDADVRVISSITDLEEVARDTSGRTIVSVLSREVAKLSHGWEGVTGPCPKCGGVTPCAPDDLAKRRMKCEAKPLLGSGLMAQISLSLAHRLMEFAPQDESVSGLLNGRMSRKAAAHYLAKLEPRSYPGLPLDYFDETLTALKAMGGGGVAPVFKAVLWCLLAIDDQEQIAQTAQYYLDMPGYYEKEFGRDLMLLLTPNGARQRRMVKAERAKPNHSYYSPWDSFEHNVVDALEGKTHVKIFEQPISWVNGTLTVSGKEGGSLDAARSALKYLIRCSNLKWGKPCGGFLFQAVPEPRRIALAQHIQRRHPNVFDFLILDEAHEYSNENAAQTISANRLTGLRLPTIVMTGSVMNGYAESLFSIMWAVSPEFRREFNRGDKQRFNDRYGYRKRLVTENEEKQLDNVIAFGAVSDRVQRSERVIGNAPGVLPLFLLRHLLPISVTLHKTDLALDLPPCIQERHKVAPTPELKKRFLRLQQTLVNRIKKDMFKEGLAGKLFGQLAELPSYLDRSTADTGNTEDGDYEIRYPESVGGDLVGSQDAFSADTIMPKERWMLDRIVQEVAEGRNVMVFSWHVSLLPRLASMIEREIGGKVPILYANKVSTSKRQDWITKQVVKKNARVMVTNPVAIQTGLNNLVHFATEIWMENPACNPIIYRQATGRVDRIGQNLDTRILFPVYEGTLQENLHDLLMSKVAVSTATDGLDPESALLASGVGPDEFMTGLSIGKQLWAMLSGSDYERDEARAAI
jgi:hypothetical protein